MSRGPPIILLKQVHMNRCVPLFRLTGTSKPNVLIKVAHSIPLLAHPVGFEPTLSAAHTNTDSLSARLPISPRMEILGSLLIYCKWVSDNHLAEFSSFWLTLDFNLSIQFLNWLHMPVSEKNISQLVYPEGLEPSRPCGHSDLNAACLPFHHGYIESVCHFGQLVR